MYRVMQRLLSAVIACLVFSPLVQAGGRIILRPVIVKGSAWDNEDGRKLIQAQIDRAKEKWRKQGIDVDDKPVQTLAPGKGSKVSKEYHTGSEDIKALAKELNANAREIPVVFTDAIVDSWGYSVRGWTENSPVQQNTPVILISSEVKKDPAVNRDLTHELTHVLLRDPKHPDKYNNWEKHKRWEFWNMLGRAQDQDPYNNFTHFGKEGEDDFLDNDQKTKLNQYFASPPTPNNRRQLDRSLRSDYCPPRRCQPQSCHRCPPRSRQYYPPRRCQPQSCHRCPPRSRQYYPPRRCQPQSCHRYPPRSCQYYPPRRRSPRSCRRYPARRWPSAETAPQEPLYDLQQPPEEIDDDPLMPPEEVDHDPQEPPEEVDHDPQVPTEEMHHDPQASQEEVDHDPQEPSEEVDHDPQASSEETPDAMQQGSDDDHDQAQTDETDGDEQMQADDADGDHDQAQADETDGDNQMQADDADGDHDQVQADVDNGDDEMQADVDDGGGDDGGGDDGGGDDGGDGG